eukprot:SM000129S26151  [mRNA]  locus=s129:231713:232675:- [translate_table: standard]
MAAAAKAPSRPSPATAVEPEPLLAVPAPDETARLADPVSASSDAGSEASNMDHRVGIVISPAHSRDSSTADGPFLSCRPQNAIQLVTIKNDLALGKVGLKNGAHSHSGLPNAPGQRVPCPMGTP